MTSTKEQDFLHSNERGNGPKKRMEGGDQTDDIAINSVEQRLKEQHNFKRRKEDLAQDVKPQK